MSTNSTREALSSAITEYYESLSNAQFIAAKSFVEEYLEAAAEAAEVNSPLYIAYYYNLDELRETIYMLTHYKGKNIKSQDKDPKPRLDEVTITEDEEEILNRLLKLACKDVYRLLAPYGRNIQGGYVLNFAGTLPVAYSGATEYNTGDLFYVGTQLYYTLNDDAPAGTAYTNTTYFAPVGEHYNTYHKVIYTLNYDPNVDPSMISVINEDVEDCIIKHVIFNWYKTIQEMSMVALAEAEYSDAKSSLLRALWSGKTPVRRRTEMI